MGGFFAVSAMQTECHLNAEILLIEAFRAGFRGGRLQLKHACGNLVDFDHG